jgi:transcriptional regulator with XRE-family HTH domain
LLQKHVANKLDIDTPMLSKIERGERPAKKEQIVIFAKLFEISEQELLSLWLGDKVYEIIKDEEVANSALKVAEETVAYQKKMTNEKRK